MNLRDFDRGWEFEAYKFLGAHPEGNGYVFRTFAPAALRVSVIGEWDGWREHSMDRIEDGRFFSCFVDGAKGGQMYKYRIYLKNGRFYDHADPYAFYSEKRPGTASVLWDMDRYAFTDEEWMRERSSCQDKPLNIYELHLGSWHRKDTDSELLDETGHIIGGPEEEGQEEKEEADVSAGWYRYEEIAPLLIPYLRENGYNYVEFMPLAEYPADESWGYQGTGFYSATSRYGDPDGLKALIDACHQNDIGVILDVVTVHFARNDYGLLRYDGTALYEYPHPDVGESEWGSTNFMHSSALSVIEISAFLSSHSIR